jgi:type IV fimbrial biogenesis protein FimT
MLKSGNRGFSLIELMTVVAIVAVLTILALPNFSDWLQNSRTRSVAESLQNGIRFAQGEAARLSRLTTITVNTTAATWAVTYTQTTADTTSATAPANPLQSSPSANLDGVAIAASNAVLQFNNLGRVSSPALGAVTATFTVSNSHGPRSLKVQVTQAGRVHMCDPDKGAYDPDNNPDGCQP